MKTSVSHNFKMAMVLLLFILTSLRLILLFYFPLSEIISDKILLGVIVFIVLYLWVQEARDYNDLLKLNRALIESHKQLKLAHVDTIAALIKTVEAKDQYTSGHSERVTRLAIAIADEMGLDEETRTIVARAGILHDIGKIGIKDDILTKIEPLTEEDWSVIKRHPDDGVKILKPLGFLANVREVIRGHHERYDGTGYPEGLKAGQIRIESQILAVADAFDAMNSRRAYRKPLERDRIIDELKKNSGSQHSPAVVDAIFTALEKNPGLWDR